MYILAELIWWIQLLLGCSLALAAIVLAFSHRGALLVLTAAAAAFLLGPMAMDWFASSGLHIINEIIWWSILIASALIVILAVCLLVRAFWCLDSGNCREGLAEAA